MIATTIITSSIPTIRALSMELDQLGKKLEQLGKTAMEKAAQAGRLLIQCKDELPHGQWIPWLNENFTFTDRTARRWMRLAEEIDTGRIKSDTVSNLTEAYRLIEKPRPAPISLPPVEIPCPFEMPMADQRMFLIFAEPGNCDFAMMEPIDDTYTHVTYTDLHAGEVGGSKRGVQKEYAFDFLTRVTGKDWSKAITGYIPWTPTTHGKNLNLLEGGDEWSNAIMEATR